MNGPRKAVVPSNVVNDNEHGAILTIALAMSITLMLLFLSARLLIRWPWVRMLGRDDAAIAIATALGVLQAGLTYCSISSGLGSRGPEQGPILATRAAKLIYAFDLLFVATVYADKCAVVLFLIRLSGSKRTIRACTALLVTATAFFLVSMLVIGLQKPLSSPWTAVIARSRLDRWIALETLSSVLEIAIVAFPVFLVKSLQMPTNTKVTVTGWFALRLGLIPIAVCRLVSFAATIEHLDDRLYYMVVPDVLMQAQMAYGVVAATLPCLRIFLRSASPLFLDGHAYLKHTTSSAGTAGGSAYKLSNITHRSGREDEARLSHGIHQAMSQVERGRETDRVSVTSDSSRPGIVVEHTVDLTYDMRDGIEREHRS